MITATNGDEEGRRGEAETRGRGDAGTRRAPFELDFFLLLVFVVIFVLPIAYLRVTLSAELKAQSRKGDLSTWFVMVRVTSWIVAVAPGDTIH